KNEAKNLPDLLEPLHDKFDELCIVDTGSEDDTVEVAKSFGAKVYHFEWIKDFSAARNESIRHATGDWLFWLDGDDRMAGDQVAILRKLIRRHPKQDIGFYCHLHSMGHSWAGQQTLLQMRLFPKVPGLEFRNAIHERVVESLYDLQMKMDVAPVEIIHTGYIDPEALPAKYKRNLDLMSRVLENDPSHTPTRYQLVMQLVSMREYEQAMEEIETLREYVYKELENIDSPGYRYRFELLRCVTYRQCGHEEKAREALMDLVKEFPEYGIVHYLIAIAYLRQDNWEKTYEHLVKAEYYGIAVEGVPLPVRVVYFEIASMKAQYHQRKREWMLAAQQFLNSIKIQADFLPNYVDLGDAYINANNLDRAIWAFQIGIQIHDERVADVTGLDAGRLEKGTAAYGSFLELSPTARQELVERMYAGWARALAMKGDDFDARVKVEEGLERFPNSIHLSLVYIELTLRSGRTEDATRHTLTLLRNGAEHEGFLEALANLHLQFGNANGAIPTLAHLWQTAPHKWDAGLVGILMARQMGATDTATTLFQAMRRYLIAAGDAPDSWGETPTRGHPMWDFFSNVERWAAWSSPSASQTDNETERQRRRAFAEKLRAICQSLRTQFAG
ncbi:MAG: glycosyltransferase, partial [Candidatus Poribacteria bacterium]|nr:glycosyltransferase [Candidatus Poribacteria bacterium]